MLLVFQMVQASHYLHVPENVSDIIAALWIMLHSGIIILRLELCQDVVLYIFCPPELV